MSQALLLFIIYQLIPCTLQWVRRIMKSQFCGQYIYRIQFLRIKRFNLQAIITVVHHFPHISLYPFYFKSLYISQSSELVLVISSPLIGVPPTGFQPRSPASEAYDLPTKLSPHISMLIH